MQPEADTHITQNPSGNCSISLLCTFACIETNMTDMTDMHDCALHGTAFRLLCSSIFHFNDSTHNTCTSHCTTLATHMLVLYVNISTKYLSKSPQHAQYYPCILQMVSTVTYCMSSAWKHHVSYFRINDLFCASGCFIVQAAD